ncbi:hypothetical protein JYT22_00765 [Endomicrobium sp. AH-315-J14]|nr:hypothetical protein [Endomicrobium sp. AH-315-J14]
MRRRIALLLVASALITESAMASQSFEATMRSGTRVIASGQQHLGLPVLHRGTTVRTHQGRSVVSSRLASGLPSDVVPRTPRPPRSRLVIWPGPQGARLAWESTQPLRIHNGIPTRFTHIIDAHSGKLLQRYDQVRRFNQATVYPDNPVATPTRVQVSLDVDDPEAGLANEKVQALNCIDQKTVVEHDGDSFHVCDPIATAFPGAGGDYDQGPITDQSPEDVFAEVQLFFHVQRSHAFFTALSPDFSLHEQLTAVANLRVVPEDGAMDPGDPETALEPFANAFFMPPGEGHWGFESNGPSLWFGQGPVADFAYDGDVVHHEFVHAVVFASADLTHFAHLDEYGAVFSSGALNEGLADYFSGAIAGDPEMGEYASLNYSDEGSIRSLTRVEKCPDDIAGESHQDATLFSGALWTARAAIDDPEGQSLFDEAVYSALTSLPSGDVGFAEFAELVIATAKEVGVGKTTREDLRNAFEERGVLPACKRVLPHTGLALDGPWRFGGAWMAPGLLATGLDELAPGVVQFRFEGALPAGEKLEIEFLGTELPDFLGLGGTTPFKPVLLVSFGDDVGFDADPYRPAPGVERVDVAQGPEGYVGTIELVEDHASVNIMIANLGELDGIYAQVKIGIAKAGALDGSRAHRRPDRGGGCNCSLPENARDTALPLMLWLALLACARQRRNHQ